MKGKFVKLAAAVLIMSTLSAYAAAPKFEFFWPNADRSGWQAFFLLDAAKRRLGSKADFQIITTAAKDAKGEWTGDVSEPMRRAVLAKYHSAALWNYLVGLTFTRNASGWRDAAVYAGISPDKLDSEVTKNGKTALEFYSKYASSHKIASAALLFNGKEYAGGMTPSELIMAANSVLPKQSRVVLPSYSSVKPKPLSPTVWVIESSEEGGKANKEFVTAIKSLFEGGKPVVNTISYELAQKNPELSAMQYKTLPTYIISGDAEVDEFLKPYAEQGALTKQNGKYIVNGGSGEQLIIGQPAMPRTLELFVMAQCPYGLQAENAIVEAINDKNIPADVKVVVRYIVSVGDDGSISSLHGTAEWEEDIRQLVIQQKYPEKFWKYLALRNADIQSTMWESVAQEAGIDPKDITSGFDEGKKLLLSDNKRSSELGVNASPTFIWEGRRIIPGIKALSSIPGFEKVTAGTAAKKQVPAGACK